MYSKFQVDSLPGARDMNVESSYAFCYFFFFMPPSCQNRPFFVGPKTIERVGQFQPNFHNLLILSPNISFRSFIKIHHLQPKISTFKVRMQNPVCRMQSRMRFRHLPIDRKNAIRRAVECSNSSKVT